jgi:dihydroorotate dehydrogenase (NAD+) catalytic subunit
MKPDLSVDMFGLTFKNPVMGASGTVGYGVELAQYIDLNRVGAVVTKGISIEPRQGNDPPRLFETASGLLNSIGVQNIGAHRFIREVLPELRNYDTRVIVNIYGESVEDYRRAAECFQGVEGVTALEVNLSCPNVDKGGLVFGTDPALIQTVVREVKEGSKKPTIAKLTPNVTDIRPLARAARDAGADAVSLINTLAGMAVDVTTRRPFFKNVRAGLSGPAIKPVALHMVWEASRVIDIPVIGVGGIVTGQDAVEFIMAGARAVQVGTANFVDPAAMIGVIGGIESFMKENEIGKLDDIRGSIGRGDNE